MTSLEYYSDKDLNNRFKNKLQNEWLKINTILNEINRTTDKWNYPVSPKRRDEVVLNRLRVGHTH